MLKQASITAFLGATDLPRARAFFEGLLGLSVVSLDGFALVLRGANGLVRVTQVERAARAPYTVLGWDVPDIESSVAALSERGLVFTRYPGMTQDELGIWTAPSGSRIAWFKDPDENVLSLAQHPEEI
jgi:catechol 2,3-dioxygenase-like lactoylglutathione lyase family enzyme